MFDKIKKRNSTRTARRYADLSLLKTKYPYPTFVNLDIYFQGDIRLLLNRIKNPDFLHAFVSRIEERITNHEYKIISKNNSIQSVPAPSERIIDEAIRVVKDNRIRDIHFSWFKERGNINFLDNSHNKIVDGQKHIKPKVADLPKNEQRSLTDILIFGLSHTNPIEVSDTCHFIKQELIPSLDLDSGESKESSLETLSLLISERRPPKNKNEINDLENAVFYRNLNKINKHFSSEKGSAFKASTKTTSSVNSNNKSNPITGGDALSSKTAAVINCASQRMANSLIDQFISNLHGKKGTYWVQTISFFVSEDGIPKYSIRKIGIQLKNGETKEYYFDISRPHKNEMDLFNKGGGF